MTPASRFLLLVRRILFPLLPFVLMLSLLALVAEPVVSRNQGSGEDVRQAVTLALALLIPFLAFFASTLAFAPQLVDEEPAGDRVARVELWLLSLAAGILSGTTAIAALGLTCPSLQDLVFELLTPTSRPAVWFAPSTLLAIPALAFSIGAFVGAVLWSRPAVWLGGLFAVPFVGAAVIGTALWHVHRGGAPGDPSRLLWSLVAGFLVLSAIWFSQRESKSRARPLAAFVAAILMMFLVIAIDASHAVRRPVVRFAQLSPDGLRLFVNERIGSTRGRLVLLDAGSGRQIRVWRGRFDHAGWLESGGLVTLRSARSPVDALLGRSTPLHLEIFDPDGTLHRRIELSASSSLAAATSFDGKPLLILQSEQPNQARLMDGELRLLELGAGRTGVEYRVGPDAVVVGSRTPAGYRAFELRDRLALLDREGDGGAGWAFVFDGRLFTRIERLRSVLPRPVPPDPEPQPDPLEAGYVGFSPHERATNVGPGMLFLEPLHYLRRVPSSRRAELWRLDREREWQILSHFLVAGRSSAFPPVVRQPGTLELLRNGSVVFLEQEERERRLVIGSERGRQVAASEEGVDFLFRRMTGSVVTEDGWEVIRLMATGEQSQRWILYHPSSGDLVTTRWETTDPHEPRTLMRIYPRGEATYYVSPAGRPHRIEIRTPDGKIERTELDL